ncbi:ABC transporter ATP-binding protein [Streptomyces sp. NPDC059003]|uniref:ABC transporter ATP-binding protein n=1 Tax=Streptomyces sp. NPDC059003 TaxID=3346691 RepID=UPI003676ADDB
MSTPAAPVTQGGLSVAGLLHGSRTQLGCAAALAWCSIGAGLALPWMIKDVTAALTRNDPVTVPVLRLVVTALGAAVSQGGCGWLLARAGEQLVLRLRRQVIDHVVRLPLSAVRARGTGDISARITSDCAQVRAGMEAAVVHLPVAAFGTAATLMAMACLDGRLALLAVCVLVLVGAPLAGVLTRTRRVAGAQLAALADLGQRLIAHLSALTSIKAYRHEAATVRALGDAAAELGAVCVTASRLQALIGPLVGLGQQLALVVVIVAAAGRVAMGGLSLATFNAFFFLLLFLACPVTIAAVGIGHVNAGRAARERLTTLLALAQERADPPLSPARATPGAGHPAVVFQNVTFAHPGAGPALLDVSFTVPATGLTALTGPSGTGKTTALTLIGRFTHTDTGQIHVLGREVGSWQLAQLRRRVVYVEQQPTVLEGTVRENLTMGCGHDRRDEDLWDALESMGLHEAVARLSHGLDTALGRGIDLSGGQRQRLAIARALLTDADLFLLDEPTSHLDEVGEQRVLHVLDQLAVTRPVVVATHRLSALPHIRHTVAIGPAIQPEATRPPRSRTPAVLVADGSPGHDR